MAKPKAGMTEKKIKAAEMLVNGMTLEQIGDELGVTHQAVSKWKYDDEFIDYADMLSKKKMGLSAVKARQILDKHMDDKGAWVSMNAATNALREYQTVKGIGVQAIHVTFGGVEPGQVTNNDTELPE